MNKNRKKNRRNFPSVFLSPYARFAFCSSTSLPRGRFLCHSGANAAAFCQISCVLIAAHPRPDSGTGKNIG